MKKQIKMIEGLHLTATNRRHIAEIIDAGYLSQGEKDEWFGTKTITYAVRLIEGVRYSVIVRKNEKNDWGRQVTRRNSYLIEYV